MPFVLLEQLTPRTEDAVIADARDAHWSARVLDSIHLAAFVVKATGHIRYLNRAAEQLLEQGKVLRQARGGLETHIGQDTKTLQHFIALSRSGSHMRLHAHTSSDPPPSWASNRKLPP